MATVRGLRAGPVISRPDLRNALTEHTVRTGAPVTLTNVLPPTAASAGKKGFLGGGGLGFGVSVGSAVGAAVGVDVAPAGGGGGGVVAPVVSQAPAAKSSANANTAILPNMCLAPYPHRKTGRP